MTDSGEELRVSVIRYIQLLLAIGTAITVFLFIGGVVDVMLHSRNIFTWISQYYGRILLAPWSIVVIIVFFDILMGWRHTIWQVDDSGISVSATKRSRPRLVAWGDIASVRVYPFGVVAMTTTAKPVHVSMIVAVTADSSRWLRDFAARQLAEKTA